MKNRVLFILLLSTFPTLIYSQILNNVSNFSKVTAHDRITVFLIPSAENKVEVSGFNADKVELIIENNELMIKFPMQNKSEGNDILAKVYFKNLIAVEAKDGSNIGASGSITTPNFDIIGEGSSRIKLNLNAEKIKARISQGSILDLSGNTTNLDIVANNSSQILAKNCQVKEANVNVNAGGEIFVNASQLVDAKVRAGGTITIYGNPKKVNQKTILGGEIFVNAK